MAYRFNPSEPFSKAIPRIADEQIDKAILSLQRAKDDPQSILRARKSIKRMRSLLQLIRSSLPKSTFKQANERFRDVGRSLSSARDAQILLETLEKIVSGGILAGPNGRSPAAPPIVSKTARQLLQLRSDIANSQLADRSVDKEIAALLGLKKLFSELNFRKTRFSLISDGLKANYKQNQKNLEKVAKKPDAELFHDWRKNVQHHLRHLRLLSNVWPELITARIQCAKHLSDILGQHNDIDILEQVIRHAKTGDISEDEAHNVTNHCKIHKARYQLMAAPYGARLFSEPPSQFAKRFFIYWDTATKLTALPTQDPNGQSGSVPTD